MVMVAFMFTRGTIFGIRVYCLMSTAFLENGVIISPNFDCTVIKKLRNSWMREVLVQ